MSSLLDDVTPITPFTPIAATPIPWWLLYSTTTVRQQYNGYDLPLDVRTYGVPIAFTVLVVLVLCVVIAYTKAKRRRIRGLHGPVNNLRSISGGVPMNVAAYRNYGMHLGTGDPASAGHPDYPGELPPPYEIAIQTPPSSANSQAYSSAVSSMPAPPAYTEIIQQQGLTTNTNTTTTHGSAPPSHPPSSTPHTQGALITQPPTDPIQPGLQAPDSSGVDSGGQEPGNKDVEDDKKDTEHLPQVDDSGQPRGPKPGTSGDGSTTGVTPGGGDVETPSVAPTSTTTQNGSWL